MKLLYALTQSIYKCKKKGGGNQLIISTACLQRVGFSWLLLDFAKAFNLFGVYNLCIEWFFSFLLKQKSYNFS